MKFERTDIAGVVLIELEKHEDQRGYLARVYLMDPSAGIVDIGIEPLAYALDAHEEDALVVTLEADGSGAIYPILFSRRGGAMSERALEPDALARYDTPEARRAVADVVSSLIPGSARAD